MDWAKPRDVSEWIKRVFSLRSIIFVLLLLAVFISEMRFDWLEHSIGAYLVSTNSRRPESGAIWETGRRTRTAKKTLEKIAIDRETSQREARKAESFNQIASSISPDAGVMLSSDHFRQIFLKLSPEVADRIVSPYDLLKLVNDRLWTRSYFKKGSNGLTVFFLDEENRVLKQLEIEDELLADMGRTRDEIPASLDSMPGFENRIYTAGRFFAALASLPEEVRKNAVPQPEILLKNSGQIVRVGISDEIFSGTIELGFEIEKSEGVRVRLVRGRDWAVWQLRAHLEQERSGFLKTSGIPYGSPVADWGKDLR